MNAYIVLCTAATEKEAGKIAQALVRERLAACVTTVPRVLSRYWWQGKIETGREALMIMKTLSPQLGRLKKRIPELHSYTVPEILAVKVSDGGAPYLRWMESSLREPRRRKNRT